MRKLTIMLTMMILKKMPPSQVVSTYKVMKSNVVRVSNKTNIFRAQKYLPCPV